MTGKTVVDVNRAATATPIAEKANEESNIAPTRLRSDKGVSDTPARGANGRTTTPWAKAWIAPEVIFPNAIAERGIGATSTAFRNPIWRSKTMTMAAKVAENSSDSPNTPGKMYRRYSGPPSSELPPMPAPRTKRYSRGCASPAASRARSSHARLRSRMTMA